MTCTPSKQRHRSFLRRGSRGPGSGESGVGGGGDDALLHLSSSQPRLPAARSPPLLFPARASCRRECADALHSVTGAKWSGEGGGGEQRSVFGGGRVIRPCAELRRGRRGGENKPEEDYWIRGGTNRKEGYNWRNWRREKAAGVLAETKGGER